MDSSFGTCIHITTEQHLVWSINVKRLVNLLGKKDLTEEDIVDSFISLHLILEASLNSFFRELTRQNLFVSDIEVFERLDKISFTDKVSMFIYTYDFNFDKKDLKERKKHKNLVSRLINFSNIRNILLHGSTIMEVENGKGEVTMSKAKKIINQKTLKEQISSFKEIIEGMRFYIKHLKLPEEAINLLLGTTFLDHGFLKE